MEYSGATTNAGGNQLLLRGPLLILMSLAAAWLAHLAGFNQQQMMSSAIFIMIISATLLFWEFRLAIAFVGIALLLGTRALTLHSFIESSELDIILFLVGMMVTVGVLKELGLFTWIIQTVISLKQINGVGFIAIIVFMSALMACTVDEVTSIVFVSALIFQVCDTLKMRPIPFVMIAVMATNIGSSGTMLGNPVGILIGYKAGFTFGDFIVWSFPIMLVSLVVTLGLLLVWYRKEIKLLSERLQARRDMGLGLGPLVKIPYRRGLMILVGVITLIASHHWLEEEVLHVEKNTVLIVAPLFIAGLLMIWRHQRARHYIEEEVEWWTLLFFMMLFAVAGTLEHTGVTARIAEDFSQAFAGNPGLLTPVIIVVSALGSAFVDNVVFVAAFIPVVRELNMTEFWWALLFGGCFGGNITMIGSTANIVALGMLEKRYRTQIKFGEWLKIGSVVGAVTCLIAWIGLAILSPYMPEMPEAPTPVQEIQTPADTEPTPPAAH